MTTVYRIYHITYVIGVRRVAKRIRTADTGFMFRLIFLRLLRSDQFTSVSFVPNAYTVDIMILRLKSAKSLDWVC